MDTYPSSDHETDPDVLRRDILVVGHRLVDTILLYPDTPFGGLHVTPVRGTIGIIVQQKRLGSSVSMTIDVTGDRTTFTVETEVPAPVGAEIVREKYEVSMDESSYKGSRDVYDRAFGNNDKVASYGFERENPEHFLLQELQKVKSHLGEPVPEPPRKRRLLGRLGIRG